MVGDREFWEAQADAWLERFCVDGIDPWGTEFNLPEFLLVIPPPHGVTVDVGCGDGRVAELLRTSGHDVLGIDAAPTLALAASDRGVPVVIADGARLPIADAAAHLVISSMVLMDVDELDRHVDELARITATGGSVCVAVLHPIRTAGTVGDDGVFRLEEYLAGDLLDLEVRRNGGPVHLRWWRRPISTYLNAFVSAGLTLGEVREPATPDGFVEAHGGELFAHIPMFLHLRFVKA